MQNKPVSYKIVYEPSFSREYMFYNLYENGRMLSSHTTIEKAEAALSLAIVMMEKTPTIIKEITI